MNKYHANRGFTLVELLVVISVIGIMSTIVLAGLGMGRDKAYDAKKLIDVRSVDMAIKQMQMDKGKVPANYQGDSGLVGQGLGTIPAVEGTPAFDSSMQELVDAGFLPAIPKSNNLAYKYFDFGASGGRGATFWAKLSTGEISIGSDIDSKISRNVQVLKDVKALADAFKKAKVDTSSPTWYPLSTLNNKPCIKASGLCWSNKLANPEMFVALSQYLPNIPKPLTTSPSSLMSDSYYAGVKTISGGTANYIYFGQEKVSGETPFTSSQYFFPSGSYSPLSDCTKGYIRAYIIGGTSLFANDFIDANFLVCDNNYTY